MKQTIQDLANYIGKSRQSLYHMNKTNKKQFDLLWLGWITYVTYKTKDNK